MNNTNETSLLGKEKLFEYLRWNGFLSERYKLFYVATPKVACTSIKWWFADLVGYGQILRNVTDSNESDPDLIIHDSFYKLAPNVTGLLPEALLEPLTSDAYFRFAVVRNPYNRIFSAWQSKLLLREPLQISPYINCDFYNQSIKNAADIASAFEGFLEHIAENEAQNFLDVHWTPQTDLLRPDLISYSKLVQIENVNELSKALSDWLETKFVDPFATRSANESLIPFLPELITARSAELIHLLYSRDFSIFRYSEEIPPAKEVFSADQFSLAIKAIETIRGRNQRFGEVVWKINKLNQLVLERDEQLGNLNQSIAERDVQVTNLNQSVAERDVHIGSLNQSIAERDVHIGNLNKLVSEQDAQIAIASQSITQFHSFVANPLIRCIWPVRQLKKGTFNLSKIFNRLLLWTTRRLALLVPGRNENLFLALRHIYRIIPVRFETKRRWAEYMLSHNHQLRKTAIAIKGMQVVRKIGLGADVTSDTESAKLQLLRKRMLIVEHRLPTPDKTSGSLRLYSIIELLVKRGWEITFVSDAQPVDYHWVFKDVERELPKYESLLHQHDILLIYGMENLTQHIQAEGETYSLGLLSYPEIMHRYAPLVRAFMPRSHLIYDTVDLHGLRFQREAVIKKNSPELLQKAEFYEKMECANIDVADTVVAITDEERREILQRAPGANIEVIPNIHTIEAHVPPCEGREGLVFIGHYLHSPNEDAMIYFVNDVLPKIRERIGDVPLYMLGSSITEKITALASENVHAIGFVEDPAPWFAKARVFVAPLRYGAGMKGKIGQSLSLGLPIVTTSIGAEGMGLESENHVLIADSSDDFANAVIRLYGGNELWKKMSSNGQMHVDQNFSQGVAGKALDRLLTKTGISV